MARRRSKIQTLNKKKSLNIGIFIFGTILFYILVTVLIYVTGNHVTPYEVKEGSIINETSYTGFIVRDEEVIKAESTGYINFFALEGSKVGAMSCVYTLSSEELDFQSSDNTAGKKLSSEELQSVLLKIHSFNKGFQEGAYDDVAILKDNINIVLDSKSNQSRLSFLDTLSISNAADLKVYKAESDGIVSYTFDGYESVKVDEVTTDMLAKKDYNPTTVKNNTSVNKDDDIYKVIKSSDWSIVIQLTEDQYNNLKDKKYIDVEFSEDNTRLEAELSVKKKKTDYFGYLNFKSDMVRFSDERYIGVRLILDDEEGLKIPVSSVVDKDFFVVPNSYITKGGDSKDDGVLLLDKNGKSHFHAATVYYVDEKDNAYLNPLEFEENAQIRKESSEESMVLSKTAPLKGVYNINKGYANFRRIDILCQSDEYYIVSFGTLYGLTSYDHIALNASKLKENEVIY